MTPGFSMMGSGIYSTTITREIICAERCEECASHCDNEWEMDFETDDRGNVEQSITCSKCEHSYTFSEES